MSSRNGGGWFPGPVRRTRLTRAAVWRRTAAITGGSLGALLVLMIILVLALGSSAGRAGAGTATSSGQPTASRTPKPARTRTPTPTPTRVTRPSTPTASAAPDSALAAVATLTVKGRGPMNDYSRDLFGEPWADVDHNGCDQRQDVLDRDLVHTTYDGCIVLTGTLHDPYTGRTISFVRGVGTSNAVQIDHVVALGDAWQKGARRWSAAKRLRFANDTLNLLAVDGPTNQSKGDGDTATWLPPAKAYRCSYVARQVAVKRTYGLAVTAAERDAMQRVLHKCPGQRLPTRR